MKPVITKYMGPSNSRGSRIRITSEDFGVRYKGYDSELGDMQNHIAAARVMLDREGVTGDMVSLFLEKDRVVHVSIDHGDTILWKQ